MSDLVSIDKQNDVQVITVNNPPVNALSPGVPQGIAEGVQSALKDSEIVAVVLMGGGRTFIAGADIKEFGKITSGEKNPDSALPDLLEIIEGSTKPIICAIHGTALGGGLEIAMACHYRIANSEARVGQPEVKIGLIPGAGGTQRLPRLAGIARAAEICATGRMVSAAEALQCGIIDRVTEDDLPECALKFAREQATGQPPRKTRDINDRFGDPQEYSLVIADLKKQVEEKNRGQIAPLKSIEAVVLAASLPFDEAIAKEREIFFECLRSDQSQGMIHAFFAEREVGKVPGITRQTPRRKIERAAVVGAGTMGGGITMAYVNAGIPVVLKEVSQERLDNGLATIKRNYQASVKRGRMTQQEVDDRTALIEPTLDYEALAEVDIIVEAVFEGMDLKKQVFTELDSVAKAGAILASNTSTLDIDEIASATKRPQSVIGHHFFSPANIMKLLEIVRGKETGDDVIATSLDLAKRLGKVGVLVGNCFGFLGNRMFAPYMREAQFMVEEGASVEQVDHALYDFGMAMGPLAVGDLAGIDVGWRIRQEIKDKIPEGMRPQLAADKLVELGRFGQKTSAGWYRYEDGRTPIVDPEVTAIIKGVAAEADIKRREIDNQEIIERIIFSLVNEGARILEEGIALRSSDIDVAYLYGYGFPVWRGGPMKYADMVGLDKVYERVRHYHKTQGFWWEPAPLLKELAESGGTFGRWNN